MQSMGNLNNVGGMDGLSKGAKDAARVTPEDRRQNLNWIRDAEGKAEAPRAHFTLAQLPLLDNLRQVKTVGANPIVNALPIKPLSDYNLLARGNAGLNIGGVTEFDLDKLDTTGVKSSADAYKQRLAAIPLSEKLGYAGGSAGNDFINDSSRGVWWLLNAAQAVGNVSSELVANSINPRFFGKEVLSNLDDATNKGLLRYRPKIEPNSDFGSTPGSREFELEMRLNPDNYIPGAPGVSFNKATKEWGRRSYNPNVINAAAMLPTALAINEGIGLLDRKDGYTATVPGEFDPRKNDGMDAVAEVGARYFLGREGRLLNENEFRLERPDVSAGEYKAYKGYLRDREIDLNPLDGKINIGGVLKTNPDGIRGAEAQFLGKTLAMNDTIIPVVSAIAGTALGAAASRLSPRQKGLNVALLFGGGLAGYGAGRKVGGNIEEERRRRNFNERKPGVDYDLTKERSKAVLDKKYERQAANPQETKANSNAYNDRMTQQSALLDTALEQQVMVDQIADPIVKQRAQRELNTSFEMLQEVLDIEAQRGQSYG